MQKWPSHQREPFEEKQGGLKTARITRQCQGLDMKGATGSRKEDKSRKTPYHKDTFPKKEGDRMREGDLVGGKYLLRIVPMKYVQCGLFIVI